LDVENFIPERIKLSTPGRFEQQDLRLASMEFRESMAALFVVAFLHIGSCERKQAPQQESYWPAVRKIEETFRPFYADSSLDHRMVVIFCRPRPQPPMAGLSSRKRLGLKIAKQDS
jgi:hypothetical protein